MEIKTNVSSENESVIDVILEKIKNRVEFPFVNRAINTLSKD